MQRWKRLITFQTLVLIRSWIHHWLVIKGIRKFQIASQTSAEELRFDADKLIISQQLAFLYPFDALSSDLNSTWDLFPEVDRPSLEGLQWFALILSSPLFYYLWNLKTPVALSGMIIFWIFNVYSKGWLLCIRSLCHVPWSYRSVKVGGISV